MMLMLAGSVTHTSPVGVAQAARPNDLTIEGYSISNVDTGTTRESKSKDTEQSSSTLTVKALTANDEELHMRTTIKLANETVKTGLTPITFQGIAGKTYQLTVENQEVENATSSQKGGIIFNHWEDIDDTSRVRDVTMPDDGELLNVLAVYNSGDRATLEDLGVLQLVSHDLYDTVRDGPNPGNREDRRLNLSTLLDHGEEQIAVGGEPRNSENIALRTVAVKLDKMHLDLIDEGMEPEAAREKTVRAYLKMVAKAYQNTFHEPLPEAAPNEHEQKPDGTENLTGDLAMRTLHSYVPSHIMVNGEETPILDRSLRGKMLSEEDMQQLSKPLDGTFDPFLRDVTIFLPRLDAPPQKFTVDLLEKDSSFAEQFETDISFEEFLQELQDGRFDKNEQVMNYIREDMAAGLLPLQDDSDDGGDTNQRQDSGAPNEDEEEEFEEDDNEEFQPSFLRDRT
ncbi:hypothetical protein NVIE_015610 [Nitrososphaera viennensis EN76]|uniref:Uncharacterized protein n=2 Tax=Nitrososphaera viennensis TaxID=1034015 RepID=A0A060HKP5_9ARCH|nr:hypothetical protein NVIE_015610 [Nitrososphaera viennensis EN76]